MRGMRMDKSRWLLVAGVLLLYALLPLGRAFAFSADEGFEVIKAFMVHHGFTLYGQVWNDQPPVLTRLLAGARFGEHTPPACGFRRRAENLVLTDIF